jgi:hypothetical protein
MAVGNTLLTQAWNVIRDQRISEELTFDYGPAYSYPVHRKVLSSSTEKSIVSAIYNRAALDVAMIPLRHVRVDDNDKFKERIASGLNNCLTLSANVDQSSQAFIQEAVISMFDEGVVGIVPVDTSVNLANSGSFDILSLRTAKILDWFPRHVRLEIYNDRVSKQNDTKEILVLPKSKLAIIENPLYAIMNEPNSTLKRLIHKLNLLDAIDEQSGSGKLDILIQFPFTIKSDAKKDQAEKRIASLESQLQDSKHGVAYVDATEKVIQLNRPSENNLLGQIEYLTRMLYGQLGLSESIFNGTATPEEWNNYYSRTIEPILSVMTLEFKRKFLTQTAISQGHSIMYFRNLFSFVTASELAELADKFTRNEIVSSNEFRGILGMRPSSDPRADELRNKNLNEKAADTVTYRNPRQEDTSQNGS